VSKSVAALETPGKGFFVRDDGNALSALQAATHTIQAIYQCPFQAHAPLETMNCIADVRADSARIWVPTQCPEEARAEAAKMLGMPLEAVELQVTLIGGAFGRRLFADYVYEAVELSRSIAKPVQVIWTRTDDMQCGYFHPSGVERIVAGFDATRKPIAWAQRSIFSDLSMYGFPSAEDRRDPLHYFNDGMPWGSFDNPYNFPHLSADLVPLNSPVPTGPWRAVFYPTTVFARESFLDEMAHYAGQDPLDFRIRLLQPGNVLQVSDQKIDRSRLIRVLQVVADKSGWNTPLRHTADHLHGGEWRATCTTRIVSWLKWLRYRWTGGAAKCGSTAWCALSIVGS